MQHQEQNQGQSNTSTSKNKPSVQKKWSGNIDYTPKTTREGALPPPKANGFGRGAIQAKQRPVQRKPKTNLHTETTERAEVLEPALEIDLEAEGYPKIPPADLSKYADYPSTFVQRVFGYYIQALKKAKFKPSRYQSFEMVAGAYVKAHFKVSFRGVYPKISHIQTPIKYSPRIARITDFYYALEYYVEARKPLKIRQAARPTVTYTPGKPSKTTPTDDPGPRKPSKKERPHETVAGRKLHGHTFSNNAGLPDAQLGWTGYSHGDINLDELLAAFSAYGALTPNVVLTKSKVYNDLVMVAETLRYATSRFGAAYDQGSMLAKWTGHKAKIARQKNQPIPSLAASQLDDYNSAIRYISRLKDQLERVQDRTSAKIVEIEVNQQLRRRGLPEMSSQLYSFDVSLDKPRYRPSTKHKGYFTVLRSTGYENENGPFPAYYKIEGNKMKHYILDK